ncbi:MAG: hypothetical protein AAFW87_01460 [Pseudomonadota bacterium]
MSELNERDWELVNAYHDGELGNDEARAFEARLNANPALAEALESVTSVSTSLGALRPARADQTGRPALPANDTSRLAKWRPYMAAAAALAIAVFLGPTLLAKPTLMDIHTDLANQAVTDGGTTLVLQVSSDNLSDAPDLSYANLTPVASRHLEQGSVTHYAGQNGCRLSFFRGVPALSANDVPDAVQLAAWNTGVDTRHLIVATGMDRDKFDAIASYLKLLTRQEETETVLASVAKATADAVPCVG